MNGLFQRKQIHLSAQSRLATEYLFKQRKVSPELAQLFIIQRENQGKSGGKMMCVIRRNVGGGVKSVGSV
jgi:hypothetical protein